MVREEQFKEDVGAELKGEQKEDIFSRIVQFRGDFGYFDYDGKFGLTATGALKRAGYGVIAFVSGEDVSDMEPNHVRIWYDTRYTRYTDNSPELSDKAVNILGDMLNSGELSMDQVIAVKDALRATGHDVTRKYHID